MTQQHKSQGESLLRAPAKHSKDGKAKPPLFLHELIISFLGTDDDAGGGGGGGADTLH